MARKPHPPAEIVPTDFDTPQAAQVMNELQQRGAELERVQDAGLSVGRIAGRIESMLFLRTCADRVIAESFAELREGKKYKDLHFRDDTGNVRAYADLQEACAHLFGKSYRVCAELAQNYELLGSDLYDRAEQIGLHQKDYRALRALPADDQKLVTFALEGASDRDSVADLIGKLSERHAKKVAELEKQNAELKANTEVNHRLISGKNEKIDELAAKLERITHGSPDENKAAALEQEFNAIQVLNECSVAMLGYIHRFHMAAHQVLALGTATAEDAANNAVRNAYQRIADIASEGGIGVDFERIATDADVLPGEQV